MYLVFLWLILTTLGSHFLPEWSLASVALVALGCVVVFRLVLGLAGRRTKAAADEKPA